jgi:AsmA family protein
MRRSVLIILGIAGGLVALVLIGVAIAVATVDPSRFVAPLAARVKAATGRTLKVDGPVDIKISLAPRIVLPKVAFQNAPGSKTPDMLTASRIEAQIALLPLLSRRFEVIEFTLVDPVITLETDANGRGNWQFGGAPVPAAGGGAASGAATAFGIGNFAIRNGTLIYRNGATGKTTNVSIERMTMRARDLNAPIAIDFRGRVDDVPVALSGDLGPASQWLAQQSPYPVALKGEVDGQSAKLSTKIAKSGTTTTLDDLALGYGSISATGRIRSTTEGTRTRYAIALNIPTLSLAELPTSKDRGATGSAATTSPTTAQGKPAPGVATAPAATSPPAGASTAPQERWVVPDTPLPLGALAVVDGEGSVTIGELVLRDGQRLSRVTAEFNTRDTQVDLKLAAAAILGGSMNGTLQVDARQPEAPGVHLQLTAQELDLPKLAAAAGITRAITGGKVRASIDINGRGTTPHRVASTMSGTILIVSGPATLGRATTQEQSAASQIAGALDPFRTVDSATELRCAVFRLPLANGVAHVDRSIAVETGKIAGSASGTLDFRNETLDLSVQPQIREGVKIDVSQIASLVRIQGRFAKPSVAIDAAQSAQMLAKLGALRAKGGSLEALGRALIAPSGSEAAAPCAVALSGKAPPREAAPAHNAQPPLPDLGLPKDVGKALGKLLGR